MLCSPQEECTAQRSARRGSVLDWFLLMLPGGLSSPGPTLSSAEKGAAEKVPPLLPVLSSPYRDRLLSPHPRYPNDAPLWRGEPHVLMGHQTKTTEPSRSEWRFLSGEMIVFQVRTSKEKSFKFCFDARKLKDKREMRVFPLQISLMISINRFLSF